MTSLTSLISELIGAGEVMTEDYWVKAGYPPCLLDCLDGQSWDSENARYFFIRENVSDELGSALERVLRFPKIEDALEPLKQAFIEFSTAKQEEARLRRVNPEWMGHNFLFYLIRNLGAALRSPPTLNLTKKQIDEHREVARRAVRALTHNPITSHSYYDRPLDALYRVMVNKTDSYIQWKDTPVAAAFEAFIELEMALEDAEISFTFGELLDSWVRDIPRGQERGVSRPGRGDAAKRYFCVVLADRFGTMTKKSIYREVAILATAVFSDTSDDYVRKAHERAKT